MSEPLKMISLNCEGEKHWQRILPMVKKFQPDALCFQEVLQKDLSMLKSEFGMDGVFAPIANLAPGGLWGVCILTKLPFEDANYAYYKGSGDHIPHFTNDGEPNSVNRVLVTLRAEKDGLTYSLATTHFTWSFNGETIDEQRRDFQKLSQHLEQIPEVILCGDFNAPRGREIFGLLAERYTDNIPADVTSSLDPQLHRAGHKHLLVDGLFTSPVYKAEHVEMVCGVSDHCGIQASIQKVGEE